MKWKLQNAQLNKAFGLVEALIALLIVAATMIVAVDTISEGLRVAKQNEIRDQATGIMLRALEYANGYNQLELGIDNTTLLPKCYRLELSNNAGDGLQGLSSCPTGGDGLITDCTSDSPYHLEEEENQAGVDLCHQIYVTDLPIGTAAIPLDDRLRITSKVVYYLDGNKFEEKADAYFPDPRS